MDQSSIDEQFNEQLKMRIKEQIKNQIKARHSGYSFVLTCYSWSLALCLKTDFIQMNDNLNEKSIQNALARSASRVLIGEFWLWQILSRSLGIADLRVLQTYKFKKWNLCKNGGFWINTENTWQKNQHSYPNFLAFHK